eukprot:TRINITY_DN14139_c0_g2_i1.p1 TRINITY_DN14139_c0_g2~~TRINITY_DN14139_c0_g2_i1.p1  ORF type:complete len:274 (-),score=31.18 TRINITY_DN14139_c0_g2_i1:86-820(-)
MARNSDAKDGRKDVRTFPIFEYPSTDLLSLAICGYIGGRYVFLNAAAAGHGTTTRAALSFVSAIITGFGGGVAYIFLMKRGQCAFAFQTPLNVVVVLIGYAISCVTVEACQTGGALEVLVGTACGVETFQAFDCLNTAILHSWGVCKTLQDVSVKRSTLVRLLWAVVATYFYGFAGGIIRDTLAICLGMASSVGNFSPDIVIPSVFSTMFFFALAFLNAPKLVQLGVGTPAIFLAFRLAPTMLH